MYWSSAPLVVVRLMLPPASTVSGPFTDKAWASVRLKSPLPVLLKLPSDADLIGAIQRGASHRTAGSGWRP